MFYQRFALVMFVCLGLFTGWGVTQQGKDVKDPPVKQPADADTFKDDLKVVRENGFKGDGPDLLEYFRKKTQKQPGPKEVTAMVKLLGDEDFAARERAFTALVELGSYAMDAIKEGESDPDLEIRKRVADLKHRIELKAEPTLQVAAARIVAKLKPAGSAERLLEFLPFAKDPMVVDEICKALGAVAVVQGRVEPIVLKSLEDAVPIKRAGAGEALARAGAKAELPLVKKLLSDKDVTVRYRVCMAMLSLEDKEVVPVMIELLGELSPNQLWPVEEALLRLAGDKAPAVGLGNDPAGCKACRDAWHKWYTGEKTIDMTKLSEANVFLGYTLIVQHNNRIGPGGTGNVGEIFELDKEKNTRWKITLPAGYPVDAHVLAGSRVLVAEYQAHKVTERDLKGDVKWEYNCGGNPFSVQRLTNGNTFIAMQARLVEVDRNKNEVWSYQRPVQDIMRAKKLPTGEVVMITNNPNQGNAMYLRMDSRTKEIKKSFTITAVQMLFGSMEILPNGNIIVPHYNNQRVVEYNESGAQVGNPIQIAWPNSVVRLPNGNSLVTSYNQRQVYEFNGNQQVWNYQTDGIVFVARRR